MDWGFSITRAGGGAALWRMRLRRLIGLAVFGLITLAVPQAIHAAECDINICTGGNVCTISGSHTLSGGCELDLGEKDVTIANNALLKEQEGGGFTIEAHHLTLLGTLSTKSPAKGVDAGGITLLLSGDFSIPLKAKGLISSEGSVDEGVGYGGLVHVTAAGAITLQGSAGIISRPGGIIEMTGASVLLGERLSALVYSSIFLKSTAGSVTVNKPILADNVSGNVGCGGEVELEAQGGDLILNGQVTQKNVACGSGSLSFTATGNIKINKPIDASDKYHGDGGGFIAVAAGNDIIVNAPIVADGSPSIEDSFGGRILMSAGGNVFIAAKVSAKAFYEDASAGCIGIAAGPHKSIDVSGELLATSAKGPGGIIVLGDSPRDDLSECPDPNSAHAGSIVGADSIMLSGAIDSTGTDGGVNRISYQNAFTLTGASLRSNTNSATTGNIVQCGCLDDSPADSACDVNVCLSNPVGLVPGVAVPVAQVTPTVLVP
ncbi:MAG: hypothetical protein HYZ50_02310 [Deltaproteobacteria bacterium]|nr:hypothetical protein [Deltaproteobacteria bacterium]